MTFPPDSDLPMTDATEFSPMHSPLWPAPELGAPDLYIEQAREAAAVVQKGQDEFAFTPRHDRPALSTRMVAWRTFAFALQGVLDKNGITIPETILQLDPDRHFPPDSPEHDG